MNKFRILMCSIITIFFLSSCDRNTSKYLFDHPRQFHAILSECESMGFSNMQAEPKCLYAMTLLNTLVKYADAGQLTPQQFGNKILAAQQQLSDLSRRLQQANQDLLTARQSDFDQKKKETENLQQSYQVLARKVQVMVRLVAISEGM